MHAYLRAFYSSGWTPVHVSPYQHMLVFYAVMAAIAFLITPGFFLTIRNASVSLSAFLVGATWPMSFPVALLFSLF
ncbi:GhoT/OrtT family toxin [Escherichia coli]|nr:GhoT/OrtT family toxin [Escherichia coli]